MRIPLLSNGQADLVLEEHGCDEEAAGIVFRSRPEHQFVGS